ncbi:DedA family protein [Aliivibrio finisterrensis]|uniref:DedA family protein n=1 Tax=Aliivibrio finisterrensis TaxID=511998 RepID=A0A4Q5KND1_9GAMM|nr:DedA family protein [Aliivibrio finisterrensis]
MYDSMALFTGALLDALIGPNLFVPGEPFLVAAGFQLHQGVWAGVIAVLLGGLIGDQLSYWIGRRFGRKAQTRLINWQPKTRRPIARCRLLLQRKGNSVLLFARLLGPVAWIVPFIAGVNNIEWRRFSLFASIGLLLGVGQFVLWGYLLSYGIDAFPWMSDMTLFVTEHKQSIVTLLLIVIFFVMAKKFQWKDIRHWIITEFTHRK